MAIIFNLLHFLSLPLLLSAALPPPPSAISASQTLKLHGGYFISAASLTSSDHHPWNGSGTVLAPPDFAFSAIHRRRRPSLSLLLSHTLKKRLTWQDLSALSPQELHTWQPRRCLIISRGSISAVKIIHPNLYVDDHLTVHGIDRVLDPTTIPHCHVFDLTVEIKSQFLDHAARVLRRKGFSIVATAFSLKKPELLKLNGVTVFATSDKSLFSEVNGFRYDFLSHVVRNRHHLEETRRLNSIETLSPGKTITVGSESGFSEIYHNRWIVVITRSLNDVGDFYRESPSPAINGVYGEEDTAEEWRNSPPPAEERRCTAADNLYCPVREGGSDYVGESEPLVSEKLAESGPSHQVNTEGESVVETEPLDERVSGESTVDVVRRRMSALGGSGESSRVGRHSEPQKIVQFQVADDLFYYT